MLSLAVFLPLSLVLPWGDSKDSLLVYHRNNSGKSNKNRHCCKSVTICKQLHNCTWSAYRHRRHTEYMLANANALDSILRPITLVQSAILSTSERAHCALPSIYFQIWMQRAQKGVSVSIQQTLQNGSVKESGSAKKICNRILNFSVAMTEFPIFSGTQFPKEKKRQLNNHQFVRYENTSLSDTRLLERFNWRGAGPSEIRALLSGTNNNFSTF